MKKRIAGLIVFILVAFGLMAEAAQPAKTPSIATNKDKLLTLAVQGRIAAAQPARSYITTWDGKPKMAIGIGGINYNLKIGDRVFGWANGDRATVGVSAEGIGEDRFSPAWTVYTSIGNEARVVSGEARGAKGLVIGKFGGYVLLHFEDSALEKLTIGDTIQVKSCGIGLEIEGFKDVFVHSLSPELLEKLGIKVVDGKLEVPVVKEVPAEIVGQGAGGSSLSGNWHIQTCYPPDIEKYGLDGLRFGDLVLLKDIQTDYGKGYYKGGATVGVVCSGPSDVSGLGIGVTPVLSTRSGKLIGRVDPGTNIGGYLGIKMKKKEAGRRSNARSAAARSGVFKTNKDELIMTAVEGVVQPPYGRDYAVTYDGRSTVDIGMASINYTVSLGDPAYGWANADHVEPDVTIQGRDRPSPGECALAILACIGNEARVVSGEARGAKGFYIGRHAGSDDLVWLPKDALEKLALNDRIQVKARGVGLKIEGFEDVRVNKLAPELLEKIGITVEGNELVVPVVMEVPGYIMGSGIGYSFIETIDYDIQTTCPETVEELGLKKLRLGDLVAIRDHYDFFGLGRYEGAVTVGVCIHGFSDAAGHGPGINPILSAMPGRIRTRIDPNANMAFYLGLR
ncbi:MAG: DUF4438 domain-containing protein [Candidatus Aminicenantes bacterium]|nr:DUF4438 domain-containing protein [Candidatus Aminicenantes bacterium]